MLPLEKIGYFYKSAKSRIHSVPCKKQFRNFLNTYFTAFFQIQDKRVKDNVHVGGKVEKILYSVCLYSDSLNLEADDDLHMEACLTQLFFCNLLLT